ncbi:MAG TPA: hypothetical protein VFJ77_02655 [Gaiellaceae bacterium]|nr:hypothetical protein [Gaiellaceae bacterium]
MTAAAQTGSTVRRRRLRRLLLTALAVVAVGTVGTFALASSGLVAFNIITPPAGVTSSGVVSQLVSLTPSQITVQQGKKGQKVSGINLARVEVAEGYAAGQKVDVTWLDPQDAGSALHNPNSWLTFGLYYPIHMDACTGGDPADAITLTDGSDICAALDTEATGPLVDSSGQTIISKTNLSGYFVVNKDDPSTAVDCGSSGSSWCAPTGLGLDHQNVLYLTTAITVPGGIPPGQQGQASSLQFFMKVRGLAG